MKKIFKVLALTLAIALSFGIAACDKTPLSNGDGKENGKFTELNTTERVYGFSAASAGMIISSMNSKTSESFASVKSSTDNQKMIATLFSDAKDDIHGDEKPDASTPVHDSEEPETAELNRYMALVESLLSDGGFKIVSQSSERTEYTEKTIVSYTDIKGNSLQYEMYYNQKLTNKETEEDGETEENYSIEGIIVIDGKDYEIRGEKTAESGPDENEIETEFVVKMSETRYICVEQSVETEDGEFEQEYSYALYEGEVLIERSTFSYETEGNETELKMTSFNDGKKQVLYFEKDVKNGEVVIEIHIGDGTQGNGYIVHIETDENGDSRYVYEPTKFEV